MLHESTILEREIMPQVFINDFSILPSVLKSKDGVFDVVTDGGLSVGDVISELFSSKKLVVKEVLQTRPAKGEWGTPMLSQLNPIWSRIKIDK